MVAQVQTETEVPGVVSVRAVARIDRQGDARPIAGFYVRRRYHGDVFKIAKAEQFSPTWMEIVGKLPKDWKDAIEAKHGPEALELRERADAEEDEPAQFSMGQAARQPNARIDYANGRVTKGRA